VETLTNQRRGGGVVRERKRGECGWRWESKPTSEGGIIGAGWRLPREKGWRGGKSLIGSEGKNTTKGELAGWGDVANHHVEKNNGKEGGGVDFGFERIKGEHLHARQGGFRKYGG